MAYDRMDWHYGADDYPAELTESAGGTHIGMYLAWAIQKGLAGQFHIEDSSESIALVKENKMTGTEFLIKECDEKFWEEDLNEIGREFTKYYYESNKYYGDYEAAIGGNYLTLYHIPYTLENFEKVSKVLSQKYDRWFSSKNKKWWQFWR